MFQYGEIYLFGSPNVKGGQEKMQLCICPINGIFLLINSNDYKGSSFKIVKKDFFQMSNKESYISCNAPIHYTSQELKDIKPKKIGHLTLDAQTRLSEHIKQSIVMPEGDIEIISSIMDTALKLPQKSPQSTKQPIQDLDDGEEDPEDDGW